MVMGVVRQNIRLVGRDRELDLILSSVFGVAQGRPAVVLVSGEPGIGKTRLVDEVVEQGQSAGFQVAAGACSPAVEMRVPYAPVVDMLGSVLRRYPQLPDLVAPEVWRGVAPLVGFSDRVDGVDRALATTRLFAGVVELLRALGDRNPALIVVEDLHWADPATATLLAFVARRLEGARVAILVTARREPQRNGTVEDRLNELVRLPISIPIALGPLPDDDIAELLEEVAITRNTLLSKRIQERTGGVPFFALQLARHAGDGPLPLHIRDLLLAPLRNLSDSERDILVLLTVLGDTPEIQVLLTACGVSVEQANLVLRSLKNRGVIVGHGSSVRFRHALMREVVIEETLPGEAAAAHGRAADALLGRGFPGAQQSAQIGRHLLACGRVAEAFGHLVRAARQARAICAFVDSAQLYRSALDALPVAENAGTTFGETMADLRSEMAQALRWCGDTAGALELLADAGDTSGFPDRERAVLAHAKGQVLWAAGEMTSSLEEYRRATDLITDDDPLRPTALAALAHGLMATGRANDALTVADETVAVATAVGAVRARVHAEITGAAAQAQLGNVADAVAILRRCLPQARQLDDIELVHRCYGNLTFALGLACRYRELADTAAEATAVCARYGTVVSLASTVVSNQITALIHLGRWADAERLAHGVLADAAAVGIAALLHTRLAEIAVARGDQAEAARAIDAVDALGSDDPYVVSSVCAAKAERAMWSHDPRAAWAYVAEALPKLLAVDDPMPVLRISCCGLRAAADLVEVGAAHPTIPRGNLPGPDLAAIARSASDRTRSPLGRALAVLADAEAARSLAADTPEQWAAAGAANDELERPYWRSYCLMRQGAAELGRHARSAARHVLVQAIEIADGLGALPLTQEIRMLAQIGDLRLIERSDARVAAIDEQGGAPADPFGLTARERQVLELLVQGATNRVVARSLYITERTASVHVSNILRKMGAANRTHAAKIALTHPWTGPNAARDTE